MSTGIIEKKPVVIIHYEASGVLFERSLSGDELTEDNILQAMHTVMAYADLDEEEYGDDFPAEAEEAMGDYWDTLVDEVAKEFNETSKGNLVRLTEGDPLFDDLKNFTGKVVKIDHEDHMVLVRWDGWQGGHNGGTEDKNLSYWWHDTNVLKVVK